MTIDSYLEIAKPLSLSARACMALHITEAFFVKKGLCHPIIDEFFEHLWAHPLQHSPREFSQWEAMRGDLVDFGLTDDLPDDLEALLPLSGVSEEELFHVVEAPVEILWGNFFSNPNSELAQEYLERTLQLAEREGFIFPKLSIYSDSLFTDNNGWGRPVGMDTRDLWRSGGMLGKG